MVITYGIAMAMNWEKPFWAGLAVAFCSLATAGESIDRGIQRVVGTVLAGIAVLTLMALFPQDRWLFLLSMSVFIGICTYLWTSGSRNNFIWFNAGFNFPILAILGGGLALTSFDIVVLRAQETALGVVVYSLVAVLIWPKQGGASFRNSVVDISTGQSELFGRYLQMMLGAADDRGDSKLRAKLTGELAGLGGRLEGAAYDSTEIWEKRRAWRRCLQELSEFNGTLERWHSGIPDLNGLDLRRLLPGVEAFGAEIESRLFNIRAMLSGQPPGQQPRIMELHADRDALRSLSHLQRAAALLCRDQLAQIDALTLALFDTASGIGGIRSVRVQRLINKSESMPRVIDVDRLMATIRQSAVLWLTLLMAIYVPAFPNVVGTVALANAFAMAFAIVPFVHPRVLLVPSALGAAFAGSLYIFLMPHLSGFSALGAMIFVATFFIGYLFHRPQDFAARAMGLAMLVIVIGAENEQTYSFLYFANWFVAAIFFVLAMFVGWRFPISFRPEVRFLAMQRRFIRSAELLLSEEGPASDPKTAWLRRWRRAFRVHEITVLPKRLRAWSAALPPQALNKEDREHLQAFLHALEEVSDRIQALFQAESAAPPHSRATELTGVMREWRASIHESFDELAGKPHRMDLATSRMRLQDTLKRLEAQIESALDTIGEIGMSVEEGETVYRTLGACRGVSVALLKLTERVMPIDWARLREARF